MSNASSLCTIGCLIFMTHMRQYLHLWCRISMYHIMSIIFVQYDALSSSVMPYLYVPHHRHPCTISMSVIVMYYMICLIFMYHVMYYLHLSCLISMYSRLQIRWHRILRLFLKTLNLVPGVPEFSWSVSLVPFITWY